MSNKGRLPASGLGAKRPEQHALVQARLHCQHGYSLFYRSLLFLSHFRFPLLTLITARLPLISIA
jgi:hypothetical protein